MALARAKGLTSLLAMSPDMQLSNNVTHSRRKLVFWEEKFIKSSSDLLKVTPAQFSTYTHTQATSLTQGSIVFSPKLYNAKFLNRQLSPSRTVKSQH